MNEERHYCSSHEAIVKGQMNETNAGLTFSSWRLEDIGIMNWKRHTRILACLCRVRMVYFRKTLFKCFINNTRLLLCSQ